MGRAEDMIRCLSAIIVMLAISANVALAFFPHGSTAYTGPCDVTLTAGCAEAYSVSRAMTKNYAGALFQVYNGTTTTDIPQKADHTANTATLLAACANSTTCVISKVYGQIHGNDLRPATTTDNGGIGIVSAACSSTYACAPPVVIDPANGLPIISTLYPTILYNGGTITGISGGAGPTSVFAYLPTNAGVAECCGFFGIAHAYSVTNVAGQDFLPGLTYGNGHTYSNCATSTTICANIDIETYMDNGADYAPTALQAVNYLATFDGTVASGGTNTIKISINNSTPIYSGAPSHSTAMNAGIYPRIGSGGDGSHTNTMLQEGLIANAAWTATDYSNITGNVSSFYSGRSKDACSGTGDIGYYWSNTGHAFSGDVSTLSGIVAYALRRIRASYYGPIADLRRASDSAVQTFGPNSTGCGIDAAAAASFCSGTTCYVAKLYNQGTYSSVNVGNAHDTNLDLVQAITANQPSVDFTGLNGYPVMSFAGSQSLCSGTPGSNQTYFTNAAVVAKRTANATSTSAVFNIAGNNSSIGFSNSSGALYSFLTTTPVSISGGSYTESHWHSIVAEVLNSSGNQSSLYGDNSSVGTPATTPFPQIGGSVTNAICLGVVVNAGTPQSYLTGEIAEAVAVASSTPGGNGVTMHSTIFTAQQATWGTLPN